MPQDENTARRLGRYCEKHQRKFQRLGIDRMSITGCRACVLENAEAFTTLRDAVVRMHAGPKEDDNLAK